MPRSSSATTRRCAAGRSRSAAAGARGVVMAASYEARVFGVRSAMPGFQARRLCPELVFVPTRFDAYHAASGQIRAIFRSYTELVEPLSLDEAYLDVTAPKRGPSSATAIARAIKREILAATGLTASAGVSFNKFLAKVASAIDKPDGLYVIRPQDAAAFIARLPIERFFGVGPVTARKMKEAGIHNGEDLCARSEAELVNRFGKVGRHYFRIARGEDEREVSPDRPYKSIGAEETFATDLSGARCDARGAPADRRAGRRAHGRSRSVRAHRHAQDQARRLHVNTRQHTLADPVHSAEELMQLARWLLHTPAPPARPVRLLGLTASNFARASPAPRRSS